jgi:hypothetical protein
MRDIIIGHGKNGDLRNGALAADDLSGPLVTTLEKALLSSKDIY